MINITLYLQEWNPSVAMKTLSKNLKLVELTKEKSQFFIVLPRILSR